MPSAMQTSFASGELDPALHARVDLSRYLSGLRTCRNFLVRSKGGAANRPGTVHLGGVRGWERARLLPFAYSTEQTYVLEMTEGAFRIWTRARRLTVKQTDAAIANGAFTSGITSWTNRSTGTGSISGTGALALLTTGTAGGNMTAGGGLAAAFDGVTAQDSSACARAAATDDARIGKDWGSGVTKTIGRFRLVASSDLGFKAGGRPALRVTLEGSSDNFLGSVRELWAGTITDEAGHVLDVSDGIDLATAYRYHRLRIRGGDPAADAYVAEAQFYATDAAGQLTLVGAASSVAWAEQSVTTTKLGREHVLSFRMIGAAGTSVRVRVGSGNGAGANSDSILVDQTRGPGWHTISFTPGVSPFYIGFRNVNADTVAIDDVALLASGIAETSTPLELPHPYRAGELRQIVYTQSADVLTLTHPSHPPRELRRYGQMRWSLVDKSFAPAVATPADSSWSVAKTGSGTSKSFWYVITHENAAGEESLPSDDKQFTHDALDDSTKYFDFTITLPAGIVRANVYKYRGGTFGWIGSTDDGNFRDDGIAPELDDTPPRAANPFVGAGNYPAAATYFEQRYVLGGAALAPDTFHLSQAGAYSNFGKSEPLKDSDAIQATLASREVNRIRHLLGHGSLLIFTTGAVWRLDRGDRGLTPALEGGLKKQAAYGAAPPPPIEVGTAVLFVQEHGRAVRDLTFDVAIDAYVGEELSLLSAHLLRGRELVEWAWQADPLSVVWCVLDNGTLLSLTYNREQQVIGWGRHETAGEVESVCCVSEPGGDALYLAVRRRINGVWQRSVERLAERELTDIRDAHFVDAGVAVNDPRPLLAITLADPLIVKATGHGCSVGSYVDLAEVEGPADELNGKRFYVSAVVGDALTLSPQYRPEETIDASDWPAWVEGGVLRRAVTSVTGLSHLEGETVAILADGDRHPDKVVSGGAVTLDRPASRVHVGLPYTAELETLALALPPDLYGKRKRVAEVAVYLNASRGVLIGPRPRAGQEAQLEEWKQRQFEDWNEPTRPHSGMARVTIKGSWSEDGAIMVRQEHPLPLEVLGLLPSFEVGG